MEADLVDQSEDLVPGEPPVPDLDQPVPPNAEELLDVEGTVAHLRSLLQQPGYVDAALTHMNLGLSLYRRYDLLRDPISLHEAVTELDEAIRLARPPDNGWAKAYLATCLFRRYKDLGDDPSLNSAIEIFRDSLELLPDSSDIWWVRANLANALRNRYGISRQRAILDEAINTFRSALQYADKSHAPRICLYLSHCLTDSYDDFGDAPGLITASNFLREALSEASEPLRVVILVQLGDVNLRKYESRGELESLDIAIGSYDAALAARVPIDYPTVLTNLGNALRARYIRSKKASDLDRAISILSIAVDATPRSSETVPRRTLSLCNSLLNRYEISKESRQQDLEVAIDALRFATARCSSDHPDRARLLNTLSQALLAHDVSPVSNQNREQAIAALRVAASIAVDSFDQRPQILANLANLLFAEGQAPGAQREATRCLAEALLMTPGTDPTYDSIAQAFDRAVQIQDYIDVLQRVHEPPERLIVAIQPLTNEPASNFSRITLFLQQYLRSLDPDCVETVLDREPPSSADASSIPTAGKLIINIEPTGGKLSALASILRLWASKYGRHLNVTLTLPDGDLTVELSPPPPDDIDQPSGTHSPSERG